YSGTSETPIRRTCTSTSWTARRRCARTACRTPSRRSSGRRGDQRGAALEGRPAPIDAKALSGKHVNQLPLHDQLGTFPERGIRPCARAQRSCRQRGEGGQDERGGGR